MVRKRRKKESEEEVISIPPETESEEIIAEYQDYIKVAEEVLTTEFDSLPEKVLPKVIELPKIQEIKYLGVAEVFIIKGPITGERYRFTSKDRISMVAIEDYEGLLQRVRPARRCCGRRAGDPGRMVSSQPYFGPV